MLKDFKTFIMRGNVVDMAVGIIIGAAFGTIVGSLVKDVIMPPVGLALGKIDFSNLAIVIKQGPTPGALHDTCGGSSCRRGYTQLWALHK